MIDYAINMEINRKKKQISKTYGTGLIQIFSFRKVTMN